MAEAIILSPVATLIIERLGSASVEQIGLLWGVRDELQKLEDALSTIKAVLLDAEKQQTHSNQVRQWLERLVSVVSEADDLVDGVATEGQWRKLMSGTKVGKKVRLFFSSSNQLVFRRKIAKEIKDVRKRLAAIATDRRDFHLMESREETKPVRSWRETHSVVVEKNVLGRDKDKMAVLDVLLYPETRIRQEKVSVIPILGMGGLGKTTLARLVFNDESVQTHFDLKIWVCVSDDFDEKLLVGKIVKTITGTSTENLEMEQLQIKLRKEINGRRYLLVLDDVWNENQQKWKNLKDLLTSCGECGSWIIVTTRSETVAKVSSNVQPYHLGLLDEEDSWSLLKKIAFQQGQEPTESTIIDIGKQIVKKCGGIPLAIEMIGSMLSFKDPKTDWSAFLNTELSRIPQEENDILPTLKLSYTCLPPHLKHCFAYCRLFPKDYRIDIETLIKLWIAQGFIGESSDRSQSLEEIGYDHFMELFWRSFFQEAEIDELNKIKSCKMHDLVHDLATQVAGRELCAILDPANKENISAEVRHVSFGLNLKFLEVESSLLKAKRLRTFLILHHRDFIGSGELLCKAMISNFKFLRMLDLNDLGIGRLPKSIGKLKHLRYLDLSGNQIQVLPNSICKLANLQTLKLNSCSMLRELPRDISRLINLRHLEFHSTSSCSSHMPRGVSQMTNLQTLSNFVLSEDPTLAFRSSTLNELMPLKNLRILGIQQLRSGIESKGANLKEKEHLQTLYLQWLYRVHADAPTSTSQEQEKTLEGLQPHLNLRKLIVVRFDGIKFSSWLSQLTNLVELQLENCFECKKLPSLDQLHLLKEMRLRNCLDLEYIITDVHGDGDFIAETSSLTVHALPSLQQLELIQLPNFKGWQRPDITENEHQIVQLPLYFPSLISLTISNCPEITFLPLYPNVKMLQLSNTNRKPFEQTVSWPQISTTKTMELSLPSSSSSSTSLLPPSLSVSTFYPLSQVKCLTLYFSSYMNLARFPNWMKNLSHLERLEIIGKSELRKPQCIEFFSKNLEWQIEESDDCETSNGNQATWETFASIRELYLEGVPILEYPSLAFQFLTSLEKLQIKNCDKLEKLISTDSNSAMWENLTSLRYLVFYSLPELRYLYPGIQYLTSLEELRIGDCEELELIPGGINQVKWENLTSLRALYFADLPKLVALPQQLQKATTLEDLRFINCNLTAIPDWICELRSLKRLDIVDCPEMESLPGSISSLTGIQVLSILDCPILLERCRTTGEDWPKIKHIPKLNLNYVDDDV